MISPQGTVWLGNVPWDSSYKHIYYEGMMDKAGRILPLLSLQTTNYTYIREDSNIRVPYNADSLYGINYCMYKNDGMWFCAFVNSITYVSNNTALLHLQEDVWHTWGENLVWRPCLIEREHVNSDNLGEWRAPEPAMELEDVTLTVQRFTQLAYGAIVVGVNAIPHLKYPLSGGTIFDQHTESDFDGSDPVAGGFYNALYSGAAYYGFTSSEMTYLSNFLNNLNLCGAAESICCMFMVPEGFLQTDSDHRVTDYALGGTDGGFSAPQYHSDGYIPRNKKCLTYPYAFASITDYSGGEMAVKYEDCNTWGEVRYKFQQGLDPTAQIMCTLMDYMDQSLNFAYAMPVSQNPQCSWVYSAYQNWVAQNSSAISLKTGMNILGVMVGTTVAAAGAALFFAGGGFGVPVIGAGGFLEELGVSSLSATGAGIAAGGAKTFGSAVSNQAGLVNTIDVQKKKPNHVVGQSSCNSLQGIARNEGGFVCHGLDRQSAERLDAFFDVFGYQIDKVKAPNVTGRPSWNYVKTVGADMVGGIPADRLSIINGCLDGGITFWHVPAVGNYGLNNQI